MNGTRFREIRSPLIFGAETLASKHVVYLSGLASTGLEGREAAEIARQAPGVVRVVNGIAVQQ